MEYRIIQAESLLSLVDCPVIFPCKPTCIFIPLNDIEYKIINRISSDQNWEYLGEQKDTIKNIFQYFQQFKLALLIHSGIDIEVITLHDMKRYKSGRVGFENTVFNLIGLIGIDNR